MGELTERLLIAAPPDLVYELVDDPGRYAEWQPYLKSVVERAGRNDGIGSSFGAVYGVFGRNLLTHWVITAAEHGRLLETSGTATGGWAHWRFALEPAADDACRLSSTLEYEMPGAIFAGPVAAVAHVVLGRRFHETILRLRALAEAEVVERGRLETGVDVGSPAANEDGDQTGASDDPGPASGVPVMGPTPGDRPADTGAYGVGPGQFTSGTVPTNGGPVGVGPATPSSGSARRGPNAELRAAARRRETVDSPAAEVEDAERELPRTAIER